ncbi:hypothetical protein M0811_13187 [Anaeramoeba ignava]|uniref:AB hydrolase-1 domain-containing protein n=1 Tax=Anaeramoeba ignava TaxID=1746090 RepID=A0A9Q0R4M8_ANAIG|nr:hypothetical protein M0811_13187 [Anaeramoeba ignava]
MGQNIVSKFAFVPPKINQGLNYENIFIIEIDKNKRIPIVWLFPENKSNSKINDSNDSQKQKEKQKEMEEKIKSRFSIIYSHGSSECLSMIEFLIEKFVKKTRTNFFAYEYIGYPFTQGKTSEKNIYKCAEAAYNFVTNTLKIPSNRIILFGYSIGSGPTIELATKKNCAGVILVSPLLSCIRSFLKAKKRLPNDIFNNLEKMPKVNFPTLIISGSDDQLIPPDHSQILYKALPNKSQYKLHMIQGGGHNDLESEFGSEFYGVIDDFLIYLSKKNPTLDDLDDSNFHPINQKLSVLDLDDSRFTTINFQNSIDSFTYDDIFCAPFILSQSQFPFFGDSCNLENFDTFPHSQQIEHNQNENQNQNQKSK